MEFPAYYPIACHTDHIGPGSTFVAIKGQIHDGVQYIRRAIALGATTIVIQQDVDLERDVNEIILAKKITVQRVADTRLALAQLSAQAAGFPAQKLRILGITGTKGKTTSSFLLEHVLNTAGYKTALLGTVKNSIMDHDFGVGLTTQQPDYLHQFFVLCVQAGVDYVVMEVAAQGLSLHRVHGIEFDGVIFTNFSQEHGEFYDSLDAYFAAKCKIFDQLKLQAPVVVNADDNWGRKLLEQHPVWTSFGLQTTATVNAEIVGTVNNAIELKIYQNDKMQQLSCPSLLGMFNVYNLLGVYALVSKLAIDAPTIAHAFATFTKVPGRLERYALPNGATCIIDYAHNPSSFESVLSTLRQLTHKLIVVFGCGGDRDKTKRPIMGSIASKYADIVVLTSDNPRSEDPAVIMQEILLGILPENKRKIVTILDRKQAIEYAYAQSNDKSIIALLGKGPDEYQMIGNVKYRFSEVEIVQGFR